MDRETFSKGKPFAEYTDSPEFTEVYQQVSLSPEDQEFFSSFRLKVLCISEEWCKDCKREVPFIAHISDAAQWEMRIFKKDENPDLMDEYTTLGLKRIPVFIFFNETFDEVGSFIEKPPEGKTTLQVLKEVLMTVQPRV
ncbi:MAG: thioredoxin family protein [Theionarchaea archaeon]|nr:thioredoxin family protein [Theionarchaea archaeon]